MIADADVLGTELSAQKLSKVTLHRGQIPKARIFGHITNSLYSLQIPIGTLRSDHYAKNEDCHTLLILNV